MDLRQVLAIGLLIAAMAAPAPVLAQPTAQPTAPVPEVAVSIPPIHSLAAAVMVGVGTPTLLVPGGASPHRTALRPSTARHLAAADLVFWVGPELEGFLETAMARLGKKAQATALLHASGIRRLAAGHRHGQDSKTTLREKADLEKHGMDPHFWLDPENAIRVVEIIAGQLGRLDPERASLYRQNRDRTLARLRALDRDMATRLAPLSGLPYLVFHDSFAYFEAHFGLGPSEAVAIDPERKAGPRWILALRKKIAENAFRCLFREPQFPAPILARLREGTGLAIAELDPLGSGLKPGPDLYFHMMAANAAAFQACLQPARNG